MDGPNIRKSDGKYFYVVRENCYIFKEDVDEIPTKDIFLSEAPDAKTDTAKTETAKTETQEQKTDTIKTETQEPKREKRSLNDILKKNK